MSAFRRFVLSQVRPQTALTAKRLCEAAGVVPVPSSVDGVTEALFVDTLITVQSGVRVDVFSRAAFSVGNFDTRLFLGLGVDEIRALVDEVVAASKGIHDKVAALAEGDISFETAVKPLGDEDRLLTPLVSSFTFPQHTSPLKQVRDASAEAAVKWSAFTVETSMRKDVFATLQKCAAKKEPLAEEDQRLLDRFLRDFSRNGLNLSDATQSRITAIKKELSELGIQFSKNLGEENTKLHFTGVELDGVPEDILQRLPRRTEDGLYELSLKYPDALPVLKLCNVDSTRASMEAAFNSRCADANGVLLDRLVRLRQEQAGLLGFDSHAAYILDVRMAKTPEAVQSFLMDLAVKLKPLLENDMRDLLAQKQKTKKERGEAFDGKLHPWDISYYINQVEKERYEVDHQELKQYFPLETVTKGLFGIYEQLLGLRFVEVKTAEVWHPEVQMFAVHNAADDSLVGHFYMDLLPREGKYGHAAVFGLQPQAEGQLPAAALVANFSKPSADTPSLLLHSEVVTYFHEFGHVFHQICSKVKWARFAGTSVERDFVECPSQMLENWVWEPKTLQLLAGHVQNSTHKIPSDLLACLVASRNANSGYTDTRQILLGLFDQAIHSLPGADVRELWPRMQREIVGLEATPGTFFPAAFGHLAGGYDAQYYGYMWSQVYATDMFFSRFKDGDRLLDPAVGADYRGMILARGGSRDASEMLREFLGREPSPDAFLRSKGL
ncbi:hypothetical protein BC830DRAFT_1160627 [Chytriomyces sp. MP71]|nr:hypothetical protein BC830DRAFT_1160627 [Chytriomyces sp. MP71]